MDPIINVLLESDSESSSSDSEDGLDVVANVFLPELLQDSTKNENFFEQTVPQYTDRQFLQHFRVSRQVVQTLKVDFEQSEFYPKKDTGFKRINSEKCLLAFLWFTSNQGATFRDVADRFNLSISTLHAYVNSVVYFLSQLSEKVIVWPSTQEARIIARSFEEMGFPGVIGCIDGTHIKIDTPQEDPDSYLNRKKFHSIQVRYSLINSYYLWYIYIFDSYCIIWMIEVYINFK
ncbi:uncharacterized protein [Diabrotica undecimpunctata]|uniref:uncharacterized protein n=1 Tax=Diabrotica undecimpunctata TaxID=50387 RepID=UPI003B63D409